MKLGPEEIYQKHSTKYLGITLDDKLTWKPHIENLKSKLARTCYTFYKLRQYTTESTLKMLYHGLVYPHLQYCITSWGSAADYLLSKIFIMQKSIIKIICKRSRQDSSNQLFIKFGLLKLKEIYKLQISIQNEQGQ